MSETTTSKSEQNRQGSDDRPALVKHVLTLRTDRSDRAALRRGQRLETNYFALPLLGAYLSGRESTDQACYRFAALCASFPAVADLAGQRFGQVMRRNDPDQGASDGAVAKRLFVMQRQPLRIADSTFRSLLQIVDPVGVDWADLYWLYMFWDHPNRAKRIGRRQQVLEQFYRPIAVSKTDEPDQPSDGTAITNQPNKTDLETSKNG